MEFLILSILLILLLPTAYAAIIGAPIVLTKKSLIAEIIKNSNFKNGETFYELGTGTGKIMAAVAQKGIKTVGFELSPIFYLITLLNLKLRGAKNYELYRKNFFKEDLSGADVLFCFLTPKAMDKLKSKFLEELKPGAKIISYVFKIKDWSPYAVIKENGKAPLYFYQIK